VWALEVGAGLVGFCMAKEVARELLEALLFNG